MNIFGWVLFALLLALSLSLAFLLPKSFHDNSTSLSYERLSAVNNFRASAELYYAKYKRFPNSAQELHQITLEHSEELARKNPAQNPNLYKTGVLAIENPVFQHEGKACLGYGHAYDDLEKYLPSLYKSTQEKDKNAPKLDNCAGKILYQPLGNGAQDYKLIHCMRNDLLTPLIYTKDNSYGLYVDFKHKLLLFRDTYDPKIHELE